MTYYIGEKHLLRGQEDELFTTLAKFGSVSEVTSDGLLLECGVF